ncbi:MAG: GAF domain-containing sensor histidine kinase [Steroidobacteraceae bacterium]|nr:GAF domain-containing sensor histidine kinase [Deltaproteobacteria bacterium]
MDSSEPLYSSRIIDIFLKLLGKRYPHVNVGELLSYAGMKAYEVADQGHWFTQEQVDRFHDRLVRMSGNEAIAREAGRFAASPDALGVMKQNILSFVGPVKTFELVNKTCSNLSRSFSMASRRIGPNKVELTATFREGVQEKPYQCENRIGTIEAVLMMFNYGLPEVEHSECIFKGGSTCRYIVKWENNPAETLVTIRNYAALLLVMVSAASLLLMPGNALNAILPTSAIVLLLAFLAEHREKKGLHSILQRLGEPTDKLLEQINANYSNAQITNEVGHAISRQTDIDGIIASVLQVLEARLGYDRGVVMLENRERTRLVFRAGFGQDEEQSELLRQADFDLEGSSGGGAFVTSYRERKPFLINTIAEYEELFPGSNRELLGKLGADAFLCCPIICDGESLGVLAVDNLKSRKPLLQTDLNLLMGIAPVIGVSIRNAELLETKEQQFNAIVQLERTRDELAAAKEISERYAEDLQLMNEEVRNFAYIVSHDLRAPLVNIKGFSAELRGALKEVAPLIEKGKSALSDKELRSLGEALDQDVPEALEFIESSVNRMDSLINAILKLSRLGRRDLKMERVDVAGIVQGILKTLGHQLEVGRVTVSIADLPTVVSDKTAVEQIVGNLLDNALKYLDRSRAGQLEVSAESGAHETTFKFRDNGRGIAPEDMGKVFEIFRRAGKQDMPGEGMGLAYVKTLVRRLGGRIWCESELGVGTLFCFTVPNHTGQPPVS